MPTLMLTRPVVLVLGLTLLLNAGLAHAGNQPKKPKNEKKNIEVVNLNILHGVDCDPPLPAEGDQCRVQDRIDLVVRHLVAAGCPDVVTLQEIVTSEFVQRSPTEFVGPLDDTTALIEERLPDLAAACGFSYEVVFDPLAVRPPVPGRGIDEELILTRFPASQFEVMPLYSPLAFLFPFFRHVLYARIDHPEGPIDVFTTHLASESDLASFRPCGPGAMLPPPFPPLSPPSCPDECAMSDTVRECQAKQVVAFVEAKHDVPEPAVISGDLNAEPGSSEYWQFAGQGWVDSHLAVGNLECNPLQTGSEGCTTGRVNTNVSDLESAELNVDRRIDFIFVVPPEEGARCLGLIQTSHHPQRPVTTTGLFAGEPNPFAPACGTSPDAICWASDHNGNQLNLACRR